MFPKLYDEFYAILQEGDEVQARQFLTAHFAEFPQNVQDDLLAAFFEEVMETSAEEAAAINSAAEDTVAATQTLQKAKRILDDKLKAAELMEEHSA